MSARSPPRSPGGPRTSTPSCWPPSGTGPLAGAGAGVGREDDVLRWLVLLDLFDEIGVELLDWFVLGPGSEVQSLRAHTGLPSLWRGT